MEKDALFLLYEKIMRNEIALRSESEIAKTYGERIIESTSEIYGATHRIFMNSQLSFVSRSYNHFYGLSDDEVYESVGAHTNLARAILKEAIMYHYGDMFGRDLPDNLHTIDSYTYRDLVDTMDVHDLAEIKYGDSSDNGARDEVSKNQRELKFIREYLDTYPKNAPLNKLNITALIRAMQKHNTPSGKLLYLSDKVAALIVTLTLDSLGSPPTMSMDYEHASDRDKVEMSMCDSNLDGRYKASEMWTIDFFELRDLVSLDRSFFFTGIIVMATLMTNECWYRWREKSYIS
ncbi:hypothetical protein IJ076_01370 [Candidatus Saccharibacteria bacterium]|nr:hypothetical protein [Candidatus Saccharibacteria bacterium]